MRKTRPIQALMFLLVTAASLTAMPHRSPAGIRSQHIVLPAPLRTTQVNANANISPGGSIDLANPAPFSANSNSTFNANAAASAGLALPAPHIVFPASR